MVTRAAEAVAWLEIILPGGSVKLHIFRSSIPLYLCDVVSRHALLQSPMIMDQNSHNILFIIAISTGHHIENFVREFDRSSRVLWGMLVLCSIQPLTLRVQIFASVDYI